MRILVTGHSGHVGGAIAQYLSGQGHDVVGLSRRPAGLPGVVDEWAMDLAEMTPATVAELARRAQCGAIVHAAASLAKGLTDPSIPLTNCLGTQQLLELAQSWKVSHFVYVSSVPVIGTPRDLPVTEEHPVAPPSAYHASKLFGEQLVRLAASEAMSGVSLRLTSPVGRGMHGGRILSVFVERALTGRPIQLAGGGLRRQNYIDVRDIARAVEASLQVATSGVFNVAGQQSVSNIELARLCVRLLGPATPVAFTGAADPEESVQWEVSIEKARRVLDFRPVHTLEDSIMSVAEGYAGRAG